MNVYNDLSSDKKQKIVKRQDTDESDRIVSMMYISKYILSVRTYCFIIGESLSKDMEHIKERIADFGASKEDAGMNEMICNKIQTSISFWRRIWKL